MQLLTKFSQASENLQPIKPSNGLQNKGVCSAWTKADASILSKLALYIRTLDRCRETIACVGLICLRGLHFACREKPIKRHCRVYTP
jgi:hypothetical protein